MSAHRDRDDLAAIGTGTALIAGGSAAARRIKGADPTLARRGAAWAGTRGMAAAGIPLVAYGALGRAQRKTPSKVAFDVVDATVDTKVSRQRRKAAHKDIAVASGAGALGGALSGMATRHASPRGKLIGTTLGTVAPTVSVAAGSRLRRRHEGVSKIWYPGKPSMSAKEKKDAVDNYQLKRRTNRANYGATVAGAGSLTLRGATTLLPKKLKAGKVVGRVNRGAEYVAGTSGAVYTGTGLAQMKSTRYEEKVEAARLAAAGAKVPKKVIGSEPVKKGVLMRRVPHSPGEFPRSDEMGLRMRGREGNRLLHPKYTLRGRGHTEGMPTKTKLVYGGGLTHQGKVAAGTAAAGTAAVGGGLYAADRQMKVKKAGTPAQIAAAARRILEELPGPTRKFPRRTMQRYNGQVLEPKTAQRAPQTPQRAYAYTRGQAPASARRTLDHQAIARADHEQVLAAKREQRAAARRQREWTKKYGAFDVAKADRFLRENAQHISPAAESGYGHLKGMKRNQQAQALAGAGLTAYAARAHFRAPRSGKLRLVHAGAEGLGVGVAAHSLHRAGELQGRMNKIKAKAYERKATGELGRDRHPQDLAKALWAVPKPPPLPKAPGQMSARLPKGLRRKPALRAASVRRTGYGLQQTTVASSYG